MPDNVLDRLPHQGAARLPEEVLLFEPGRRVIASRSLGEAAGLLNTVGYLPWVLLVEMMAQVGGLLIEAPAGGSSQFGLLAGVKRMVLHETAMVGQTVIVDCSLIRRMGDLYLIDCVGKVDDRMAAHGSVQIRCVRKETP